MGAILAWKAKNAASKLVLVVEYEGTRYCGFQYQCGVPTVQGELERAISRLTGERRRVLGASRTDAGVHAWGQVVSFNTDSGYASEVFIHALNHYLPEDIAVKEAHRAAEGFNVRRHADGREYEYHIFNSRTRSPLMRNRVYQVPRKLDIDLMNSASRDLQGKHDFVAFVTDYEKGGTERIISKAAFEKRDELVVFHIAANSFLSHQVRNTVGALVQIGLGKVPVDHVRRLLEAKIPGMAGPTAPAHGLYLTKINYPQPLGVM